MWDTHAGWKWNLTVELLPETTLEKIAAFEVLPGDDNDDQLAWDSTTHGGFSIKSVVALIRNDIQDTSDLGWEVIWRAPLPQKMQFFFLVGSTWSIND